VVSVCVCVCTSYEGEVFIAMPLFTVCLNVYRHLVLKFLIQNVSCKCG